jgi:hypothetical protein
MTDIFTNYSVGFLVITFLMAIMAKGLLNSMYNFSRGGQIVLTLTLWTYFVTQMTTEIIRTHGF